MKKLNEMRENLVLGDYGDALNNYRDSSEYICDAITEIADVNTSIYYSDIRNFISEHEEMVEEAIDEFGWEGCGGTLMKAGQMGEFMMIEQCLYEVLDDALMMTAIDFIEYDLKKANDEGEIPDELAELMEEWSTSVDHNDRMSDICDKIREWYEEQEEGKE